MVIHEHLVVDIQNRILSTDKKEIPFDPTRSQWGFECVLVSALVRSIPEILLGGLLRPALVALPRERKAFCVQWGPLSTSYSGSQT
jgi:hypothetical protein